MRNNAQNANTAFVSGGIFNFFLVMLNSVDNLTPEQVLNILFRSKNTYKAY